MMNRIGSVLVVIFVLFCVSLTGGCSKPRVELAVASQPNVNPDHSNRPSPVIVKIYELRNDLAFKQAEFTTLFDAPIQVLGADLIAADELVFIPGEARRVAYQPNPNTRFVGIVAGFRQMDRALWRVIKPVDPEKGNWVAIELNDATILVIPDRDAENWDPEEAIRQYQQQLVKPQPPVVAEASSLPAATPGQAGTRTPAQPSQQPRKGTGPHKKSPAQPSVPPKQGTKEAITIINSNELETVPSNPALSASRPPTSPTTPDAPTPSLPTMRPF